VAGYAAPYEPPREPQPERHAEAERPDELVGIDCFFVGRLQGTKGSVWQADGERRRLLFRVGRARQLPAGPPDRRPDLQTSPDGPGPSSPKPAGGWSAR